MYIFGYGSLINEASRKMTSHTGDGIPVSVGGLVRQWGKVSGSNISPLVVSEGDGECNGVLLAINEASLAAFDIRESGYRRIELPADGIRFLNNNVEVEGPVYAYVGREPEPPCHIQPIVQSYVDTVLAGCLRYSADFANAFVESTHGWHYPLINDRENPIYPRMAGVNQDDISWIDRRVHKR
ncbi:gamma-glutamylcyclotransferase [Parasalinivibrio latis]|uniref:gamma-glutamylcyclotransferase family protein n=1 Tax=Parasalinivibrio latis TaxID=2952610 RepID=UPI0030E4E4B5